MLTALRKLIAFVFLGGIFWFVCRDLGHAWDGTFRFSVGVLVVAFAVVWFTVPPLVVFFRARERRARNRAEFTEWKKVCGTAGPQPLTGEGLRLAVAADERIYFVEKGTLYADSAEPFAARLTPGRVGDVAFPSLRGRWFKAQRVRLWLTNRRLLFIGKDLHFTYALTELSAVAVHVGGLVFTARADGRSRRFAFTLHNPLIVNEIIRILSSRT